MIIAKVDDRFIRTDFTEGGGGEALVADEDEAVVALELLGDRLDQRVVLEVVLDAAAGRLDPAGAAAQTPVRKNRAPARRARGRRRAMPKTRAQAAASGRWDFFSWAAVSNSLSVIHQHQLLLLALLTQEAAVAAGDQRLVQLRLAVLVS